MKETFQEHCGNDSTLFDGKVIYDHDEQIELLEDTIERLLLSDGEDYKTIHGWDDLDSAEEEDVKLFVDHISVICLLYNMFFKRNVLHRSRNIAWCSSVYIKESIKCRKIAFRWNIG